MKQLHRFLTIGLTLLICGVGLGLASNQALAVGQVSGTVTMPSGSPYESSVNANAYLQSTASLLDTTNAEYTTEVADNGTYTFSNVDSGTYYIFVLPDTSSDYSFTADNQDVIVTDGNTTTVDTLAFTNTEFRGTVYETVNNTGVPVSDVRMEAITTDGVISRSMYTLSDGTYNIGGVTSEMNAASYDIADNPIALHAFPDNRSDLMNQNSIFDGTLQPNTIEENDVTLLNAPKIISGTVTRTDGSPVDGALVNAISFSGNSSRNTSTNENGDYSLSIIGGDWNIDVNPDYEDSNSITWAYFGTPTAVRFVDDDSSEAVTVDFTVLDAEISVTGTALNSDSSVPLTADISAVDKDGNAVYTKIDNDDGSFALSVPPGTYTLRVAPLPGRDDDKFALQTFVANPTDDTLDLGTQTGLEETATLSGTVYRLLPENDNSVADTTSVSGVEVQAWDLTNHISYSDTTDDNGIYTIPVYSASWLITTVGSEQDLIVDVAEGETSDGNDLTMTQIDGSITGQLVDSDGNPLSVDYGVVPYAVSDTGKVYSGEIAENGTDFTVDVATGHAYTISASIDPSVVYTVVEPVENVQLQDDITLALTTETATLSGTIVDSDGATITGLDVSLGFVQGDNLKETTVNTDGSYAISLAPGDWLMSYQITEDSDTYLQSNSTESITVDSSGSTHTIIIPSNLETVSGTVTDETGQPVYDAEVMVSNHSEVEVAAESGEDINPSDITQVVATTDASGEYAAEVPSGEYEVTLSNYVSAELPAEAETVTVDEAAVSEIDLAYTEATVTLSGIVQRDGTAMPNSEVKIFSDNGYTNIITTDSEGEYSADIIDGTYSIEALALVDGVLYRSGLESVEVSSDTEYDLDIVQDENVSVATAEKLDFDAEESQYIALGNSMAIHIPAYTVGTSGTYSIFITPVLDVNESASNNLVNLGYQALVFDSNNVPVYKFNRDVVIHSRYTDAELEDQGIAEEGLLSRYENTTTDMLEDTGVAILDTENNSLHFLQNHFTTFALTSAVQDLTKPARVTGLKVKHRTRTTALVKWKKVTNVNSYTLQLRSKKTHKVIKTYKKIHQLKKRIKHLKPGKSYVVRVRAVSSLGLQGKWSKRSSFHTKR